MASLLIKNIPKSLHKKLKELAEQHRRSMNKEAVVLLEEAVSQSYEVGEFGSALKGKFGLTREFLGKAKRKGRP